MYRKSSLLVTFIVLALLLSRIGTIAQPADARAPKPHATIMAPQAAGSVYFPIVLASNTPPPSLTPVTFFLPFQVQGSITGTVFRA